MVKAMKMTNQSTMNWFLTFIVLTTTGSVEILSPLVKSYPEMEPTVEIVALYDYQTGRIYYKDDSHRACFVEISSNLAENHFSIIIPENVSLAHPENPKFLSPLVKQFCEEFPVFTLAQFKDNVQDIVKTGRHRRSAITSGGHYPRQGGGTSQSQVQGQVYGQGFFSGQAQSQINGISQTQIQLSGTGIFGSVSSSAGNAQAQIALGEGDQGSGQAGTSGVGPSNSQVQVNLGQHGRGSMASASVMADEGVSSLATLGDPNSASNFRNSQITSHLLGTPPISGQRGFDSRQDRTFNPNSNSNGQFGRPSYPQQQRFGALPNEQLSSGYPQISPYSSRLPTLPDALYPQAAQNANLPQLPDISTVGTGASHSNLGRATIDNIGTALDPSISRSQFSLPTNYPPFYSPSVGSGGGGGGGGGVSPLQNAYNNPVISSQNGFNRQTHDSNSVYGTGDKSTAYRGQISPSMQLGRGTADLYSSTPHTISNGQRDRQNYYTSSRDRFANDFGTQLGRTNGVGSISPGTHVPSTQQAVEQSQVGTRQTIGDGYIPTRDGYVRPYIANQQDTSIYGRNGFLASTLTPFVTQPYPLFTQSIPTTSFPISYTTPTIFPLQQYTPSGQISAAVMPQQQYPSPTNGRTTTGYSYPTAVNYGQPISRPQYGVSQPQPSYTDNNVANGKQCSIVTFTCTILIESDGRAKICRPTGSTTNGNNNANNGRGQFDHGKNMQICCC